MRRLNQTTRYRHTLMIVLLCAVLTNLPVDPFILGGGIALRKNMVPPLVRPAAAAAPLLEGIPVLQDVEQLTVGSAYACTIMTDGSVKCWGNNSQGQFGDGSTTGRSTPTDVPNLSSNYASLSAGLAHTCGVTIAGGVKCWGDNFYGQLGDGTKNDKTTPVDVSGLTSGVMAVSAGGSHSCALTSAGSVKCWGANYDGQLGDGTGTESTVPVEVAGLSSSVIEITVGSTHTCAITDSGGAKCWGGNSRGESGGGVFPQNDTPVDVIGLASGVSNISAGRWQTCAVTDAGIVKCWGVHFGGLATNVSDLTASVQTVAVGGDHACTLTDDGGVKCWGFNGDGRLGDNTIERRYTTADDVLDLESGVRSIDVGGGFSCALMDNSQVKCWGGNGDGASGYAQNLIGSLTPVTVPFTDSFSQIVSGSHSCGLLNNGGIKCWGQNYISNYSFNGALGDGGIVPYRSTIPVDVYGLSSGITELATTFAGDPVTCALNENGRVRCWGTNNHGELGTSTPYASAIPVDIVGLTSGVASIEGGYEYFCAITEDGQGKCWGKNDRGQLGNGTIGEEVSTPSTINGLGAPISTLGLGADHACALIDTGGVKCWGRGLFGQLGNDTNSSRSLTPVDVVGLTSGVSDIASGWYYSCAVTTEGGVKCWGDNRDGKLGTGTNENSNIPVDVVGLSDNVIDVVIGGQTSCVLTDDGGVKCWGNNVNGTLGNGSTSNSSTPVDVVGLGARVSSISASGSTICALMIDGVVKCWGSNYTGQFGNGIATRSMVIPTNVIDPSRIPLGDVSCNGVNSGFDGFYVLQMDAKLRSASGQCSAANDSVYLPACDVNGDGSCTGFDGFLLLQCDAGVNNVFCPSSQE